MRVGEGNDLAGTAISFNVKDRRSFGALQDEARTGFTNITKSPGAVGERESASVTSGNLGVGGFGGVGEPLMRLLSGLVVGVVGKSVVYQQTVSERL